MRVIAIMLVLLSTSGCALLPLVSGYKEIGFSRGDREVLLNKEVQKFQQALYWGDMQSALSFTTPEARAHIRRSMAEDKKNKVRVVGSEIDDLHLDEDGYDAAIAVRVKRYRAPFYVVNEETFLEDWTFTTASGWKLSGREQEFVDG